MALVPSTVSGGMFPGMIDAHESDNQVDNVEHICIVVDQARLMRHGKKPSTIRLAEWTKTETLLSQLGSKGPIEPQVLSLVRKCLKYCSDFECTHDEFYLAKAQIARSQAHQLSGDCISALTSLGALQANFIRDEKIKSGLLFKFKPVPNGSKHLYNTAVVVLERNPYLSMQDFTDCMTTLLHVSKECINCLVEEIPRVTQPAPLPQPAAQGHGAVTNNNNFNGSAGTVNTGNTAGNVGTTNNSRDTYNGHVYSGVHHHHHYSNSAPTETRSPARLNAQDVIAPPRDRSTSPLIRPPPPQEAKAEEAIAPAIRSTLPAIRSPQGTTAEDSIVLSSDDESEAPILPSREEVVSASSLADEERA